ncbi:DJ-1/PfpI family protein [Mangrovivirga cuniculi]|uniref:AraC family transcriptional regulator n=1 Tax=Mangrovivirga cuniculi TaxID=2715131 RepID=A0A4D7K171_9BACT|nr:DJ-1/PfpI family protein [Mangrovivirga cuniculi]QCK14614.1 AraC family transcriptional regulator [Mangrovivirga cuniculi]
MSKIRKRPIVIIKNSINNMSTTVGFFIYDNMELMDFAGPWEVLSVASEIVKDEQSLKLYSFADVRRSINTINGVTITPDFVIDEIPDTDILIIPGGNGSKRIIDQDHLMNSLNKIISLVELTATVCSGARIAASLGLLKERKFTTHYSVFDDVMKIEPTANPDFDNRFMHDSKIITSAGVSAGIDMAIYLVSTIFDDDIAQKTAKFIEYPYYIYNT